MSDEHDSWFQDVFGVNLGGAAKRIEDEARAAAKRIEEEARAAKAQVTNIVQTVQKKVDGAIDDVVSGVSGVVKKATEVAGGAGGAGAPKPAARSGGGTGKFPLSGSVGNGGQNDPNDVKAVQQALGIAVDGQCGGGTIKAIEEFQRSIGQSNPDGRVDAGGATERALAGGAKPAPKAASSEGSDDFLGKALAGAKGLAGTMADGLGDLAGGLPGKAIELGKDLGAGLAGGLSGGVLGDFAGQLPGAGSPLGGVTPGDARSSFSLFDSYGGEVTFSEMSVGKRDLGPYFEFEGKVSGSVKFGGSAASISGPSKVEVEQGVLEFAKSVFREGVANFKTETGAGIKPNATKAGRGLSLGGAVTFKTNIGPLTIEFATIEVSLANYDAKKGISGPKASASTSRSLGYKKTIKGVELEGAIAVTLTGELTPNYVGIGQWLAANGADAASTAILTTIDAAMVAGPPLLVGIIVAQGIYMAGEKGQLDAAIYEGAIDARQAAFDYANTMTGSEGSGSGPRAKAAVALAKKLLSESASKSQVSLDDLMAELRKMAPHPDFKRIHAQARQQIFSAYYAEVMGVIKKWRKEHYVLAAWTTEADDYIAAEKKVAMIFAK